jgi:hypothetical protein
VLTTATIVAVAQAACLLLSGGADGVTRFGLQTRSPHSGELALALMVNISTAHWQVSDALSRSKIPEMAAGTPNQRSMLMSMPDPFMHPTGTSGRTTRMLCFTGREYQRYILSVSPSTPASDRRISSFQLFPVLHHSELTTRKPR